jgi:hypothetical protein
VVSYAGPIPDIAIDAGTDQDRARVETIVREALDQRPHSEPWAVIGLAAAGYTPIPGPCPH